MVTQTQENNLMAHLYNDDVETLHYPQEWKDAVEQWLRELDAEDEYEAWDRARRQDPNFTPSY